MAIQRGPLVYAVEAIDNGGRALNLVIRAAPRCGRVPRRPVQRRRSDQWRGRRRPSVPRRSVLRVEQPRPGRDGRVDQREAVTRRRKTAENAERAWFDRLTMSARPERVEGQVLCGLFLPSQLPASDRWPATRGRRSVDDGGDVERDRPRLPAIDRDADHERRRAGRRGCQVFMQPVTTPACRARRPAARPSTPPSERSADAERHRQQHGFRDRLRRERRGEASSARGRGTRRSRGRSGRRAGRCARQSSVSHPPARSATPASRNGSDAKQPAAERREPQLA